jgi:hypothetical protein
MASELRVNTLKDAAGNNSVAMSTVGPGTPKGFCHFNQATPAIVNSLNASSLTDTAAGHGAVNWTSAMSNANYTCTTGNKTVASTDPYAVVLNDDFSYVTRTASAWSFNSYYISSSAGAAFDSSSAICTAMGDLA